MKEVKPIIRIIIITLIIFSIGYFILVIKSWEEVYTEAQMRLKEPPNKLHKKRGGYYDHYLECSWVGGKSSIPLDSPDIGEFSADQYMRWQFGDNIKCEIIRVHQEIIYDE